MQRGGGYNNGFNRNIKLEELKEKNKVDYELAYKTNLYWANFTKTGNPNGDNLPKWNERNVMEIK